MNTVYLNQKKFWNNYNGNSTPGAAAEAAAPIFKKLGKWVFSAGTKIDVSYDCRTKIILNLFSLFYASLLTWIECENDYKSVALPIGL